MVEVLAVELPADAATVEIEVEMVTLPAEPAEPAEPLVAAAPVDALAEDTPTPWVEQDDLAPDSSAEVVPEAAPAAPARHGGLFARWSRTPAPPVTADADAVVVDDEVADAVVVGDEVADADAVVVGDEVADADAVVVDDEVADADAVVVDDEVGDADAVVVDDEVADADAVVVDDEVAEAPVEPHLVDETPGSRPAPGRRRLFGRRARAQDRPVEPAPATSGEVPEAEVQAVEPLAEPEPEPLSAPVSVAPDPEPVVAPEPEPVAVVEPEPAPTRAPAVYAKAVDVLPHQPVRGGGLFGRHRRPQSAPAPAVQPGPVQPGPVQPEALQPVQPVQPVQPEPVPAPVAASPEAPGTADDLVSDLFGGPSVPVAPLAPSAPQPRLDVPPAAPAEVAGTAADLVPDLFGAPVAPASASPPGALPGRTPVAPVEPPAPVEHPSADLDRMAAQAEMHQSALSALRGLYEPSFTPVPQQAPTAPAGLSRRTPKAATEVPDPREGAAPPPRARSAAEVRGMLSGFRAGVERGRGSAGGENAPDDAPGSQPGTHPDTHPDTSTR